MSSREATSSGRHDECRTRQCRTAAKRATARCLAARAAVDRYGLGRVNAPHTTPRGQSMARAREWVGVEAQGEVPEEPTSQEPGTRYDLDDDDSVLELGGSRPDWLLPVSGPQERVQRHTVEQIIDTFVPVPMLDAPALVVDQPMDVLKIIDTMLPDVEQVIEVLKFVLLPRVPQPVEQLVGVPVPESAGVEGCLVAARGWGYWRQSGTRRVNWYPPKLHRQPMAVCKYWGRLTWSTSLATSSSSFCNGWFLRFVD